jgi:hypothetical protein
LGDGLGEGLGLGGSAPLAQAGAEDNERTARRRVAFNFCVVKAHRR